MPGRFDHIEVIDDATVEKLRKKTPAEKLAIGNAIWCYARDMLRKRVSREHPDWMKEEIAREVALRIAAAEFEEECIKTIPLSMFLD